MQSLPALVALTAGLSVAEAVVRPFEAAGWGWPEAQNFQWAGAWNIVRQGWIAVGSDWTACACVRDSMRWGDSGPEFRTSSGWTLWVPPADRVVALWNPNHQTWTYWDGEAWVSIAQKDWSKSGRAEQTIGWSGKSQ